ncbi:MULTISPECIES: type VI secretion system lipoprotein TssJ [unclassified Pseudomonas]|uniref:type VI secretion system lipoprotein TssJ n=1 Tax=unclassified Pseudomonas TaxID=196821 RepID=UPI0021CA6F51|nr:MULTISPECIES: type VI secretion system lipoprotein TssJ [unclassified Pseudomonas]MCU1735203.1 type VI secretion system lipoprotein TssJ [Pseudomonas sp. 20P_3.2_Bac4]MCU1746811.1 type VI secretion system lipoprotein TssJ [Pseudomonas sp. 20P_3.2_Bac5]
MRHAIALLLASAALVGCSTVGNVLTKTGQVLMSPSIQVGAAQDQPSQVALSLYASPDVNPNSLSYPAAAPVDEAEPAPWDQEEQGPFAVNFRSASKDDLIEHLRALLGHFESERTSAFTTLAVRQRLAIPGLAVDEHAPPLTLGKSQPETLFAGTTTARWPLPSNWVLRQAPVLSNREGGVGASAMGSPDLGQYGREPVLAQAAEVRAPPNNATPVGFRVLQLKDDSMLENADPELLRNTPEKVLGSTLLASDDYILTPGQFKFIEFADVDEKARYIAVVADFHDPNAERWHDVFRIEPRGRKYPLMVMLQGSRVALTDESYRSAPAPGDASSPARTYR